MDLCFALLVRLIYERTVTLYDWEDLTSTATILPVQGPARRLRGLTVDDFDRFRLAR